MNKRTNKPKMHSLLKEYVFQSSACAISITAHMVLECGNVIDANAEVHVGQ